jgi:hypothetical protein
MGLRNFLQIVFLFSLVSDVDEQQIYFYFGLPVFDANMTRAFLIL